MLLFLSISGILNGISCLALGIFAFLKNRSSPINRTYFYFAISVAVWSFGYIFWPLAKEKTVALNSFRLLHLGAIFITVCYYHFICALTHLIQKNRKIIFLGYILGILFSISVPTKLFIKDMAPKFVLKFWGIPGILYHFFLVFFFSYVILAIAILMQEFKSSKGEKRKQYGYVLLASIFGYLGGSTNYPLWYNIQIYPVLNILVTLYVGISAYAVIKYRLMDIKVAITRSSIFVAVYTIVLGLPFALTVWLKNQLIGLFGLNWWIMPLGLMALLATVGPFIYIYLDQKAEERLLREQRRYQETLKQASLGMTRIRNLHRLLNLIAHIVTKTVKISYVAVYLHNKETGEYVIQVRRGKGRTPVPSLTLNNPLLKLLQERREAVLYDEIEHREEDERDITSKIYAENLYLLNATVVVPSFLEDKFLGFIVLGDKVSGQVYTPEDLNIFRVLASQAALAIENAQFYEETKEMQEQISQAEKMATIGTMADGLSHQINNRFHALSLITADTMDTLKMTDASGCSPEVKQMLGEINHALSRIKANVMQGGEVVSSILKYSRKGSEGFEPLDLNTILDNTLEMVQYKVKLSEIDIIRDFKDAPKVHGNLAQLQEAFFNFIDNAYDAITERRDTLKEAGYRGKITISAWPNHNNALEIIIEDNGIGAKNEDLKKFFTPFFTTKTSARKGTGLGLYVVRRIITDTHKGRISFSSSYKEGTRFTLELPIAA